MYVSPVPGNSAGTVILSVILLSVIEGKRKTEERSGRSACDERDGVGPGEVMCDAHERGRQSKLERALGFSELERERLQACQPVSIPSTCMYATTRCYQVQYSTVQIQIRTTTSIGARA